MKRYRSHIISPILALLVLLSTISWSVDKHLCMGRVMDVALFTNAEDCGMELAMQAFGETENHCCDDESFTLQGQDDLKLTFEDFELGQQFFVAAFFTTYFGLVPQRPESRVADDIHPPPILQQDFTILYEVFLI